MDTESNGSTLTTDFDGLRRQLTLLWIAIAVLGITLSATVILILTTTVFAPDVLTVERLEIVEPDGSLSMVLANSRRPAVATIDGKVVMEGQEEERKGTPTMVFFDGQGDEVGGMMFGVRETPDGYSAIRHLSLDAYNQDQSVVLMHYQSPEGSTSGLRIVDRPDISLLDGLVQLGLSAGASREQIQAAIQALPEEGREARLQGLAGTGRAFLGSNPGGEANLTLRDGEGRPRIIIEVPREREPSIQVLDEEGATVLRLPAL